MTERKLLAAALSGHRGSVLAAGFWVKSATESDARRQVLELWEGGANVRRLAEGYLVLLRKERRVMAELGAAAPLVKHGSCLSSVALRPRELAALPPNTLLLVSGGVAFPFAIDQLEAVDPMSWLDVGSFALLNGKSLGETAKPSAALSAPADPQVMFDQRVGRSAEDKARQADVLQALQKSSAHAAGERGGSKAPGGTSVAGLAVQLLRQAASWFFRRDRRRAGAGRASNSSTLAKSGVQRPGLWQRLKTAFATWLVNTRLAAFIGRKQAEYLRDLFDLLAQQDDEEVLRRAIPLSGEGEAGPPALLAPSPRTNFAISLGPKTLASSVGLGPDLFQRLRRSYEAVFERLNAAGKHEQAAYFLAEILGEAERAVAYLEQHGERLLAAKLAEARQLAPGLVVRQWFLAGDRERAILIAVREGAFNDAIVRLEKTGQKEAAAALRLFQAERLAHAGLFVRAAELAHQLEAGRALALRWLELARSAGELRGIPLELSLDQSRFDAAQQALAPLLESGVEQLPTLLHVAEQFTKLNVEAGRPLARELTREMLAIAASTGMASVATAAVRVANYVGGAFKADQPRIASFERPPGGARRRYEYAGTDAGTGPAHDVHRFGSHFLVALGEAGVALLNRQGRRVAHFELPAVAFVTSPDSGRVLCVAQRNDRLEIGRIDLATRRSERWCELEAASFARSFDGETWLVCTTGWTQRAQESELLQLDVLDEKPRVMRRLPMPLEGPTIHSDGRHVNLVGSEPFGSIERLRYELPQLTLRQREVLVPFGKLDDSVPPRFFIGGAAAVGDKPAFVYSRWTDEPAPTVSVGDHPIKFSSDELERWVSITMHGQNYAICLQDDARTRILVGAINSPEPHVNLLLQGAEHSAVRFCDDLLLVADGAGRIIGINTATGAPVYDLRT